MLADYQEGQQQKYADGTRHDKEREVIKRRPISDERRRPSLQLDSIGHGVLVSIPIAMAIANRSAPLFLVSAALLVLASRLISGAFGSRRLALEGMRTGALILVLCGVAYALISVGWAMRPILGLSSWGEAVLPAVSSTILIVSWRAAPPPRWMAGALAWTILMTAGLITVELLFDFPVRRLLADRVDGFIYNRPVVTLLLLLAPVLVLVGFRRHRTLCPALLVLVAATILISDSEAAKFGLLAVTGTFALSYAPFIWVKRLLTVALLGLIWMQPFFGNVMRNVPDAVIEATKAGHSRERIALWQAFSDVTHHYPVFGTGFASSPHMGRHPVAKHIDRAYRRMLRIGHPHNAFLQVWVELGAVGALFLSALVLWVLSCLSAVPADIRRVGLMTLMAASAIGLVSHGAWQGWWIAAIGLAAALLTLRPDRPKPMA